MLAHILRGQRTSFLCNYHHRPNLYSLQRQAIPAFLLPQTSFPFSPFHLNPPSLPFSSSSSSQAKPKRSQIYVQTPKAKSGIARFVQAVSRNSRYLCEKVKSPHPELQRAYYLAKFGVRNLRRQGILIFNPNRPSPTITTPKISEQRVVPMKCSLQFVSTPTADTEGTCLSLTFDNKRYLIGQVAEGTQRASVQIGNKFTKTQNVFLTGQTSWKNVGGIMGLVLTVSDMVIGQKKHIIQTAIDKALRKGLSISHDEASKELDPKKYCLDIHGARNLMHAIATCRRFIFRKGVPLNVYECTDLDLKIDENGQPIPTWHDENIKVWAMVTVPERGETPSPVSSTSTSSRKRSVNEMEDDNHISQYDDIRRAVVADMFSSNWKLDILHECDLRELTGPAKIFIKDPISNQMTMYSGPVPWKHENVPNIRVHVRRPWPAALVEYLPPTTPSKESTSYIFRTYPYRGKFLPEKALALKVKKGILFSQLTKGESVLNQDGETITPEMVMEAPVEGSAIAVLDIPSLEYVHPLLNREEWRNEDISKGLATIVWILGPGVLAHPEVQAFMATWESVKHVVSSPDTAKNRISMDSSYTSTMRLRKLDPSRFSDLHFEPAEPVVSGIGEKPVFAHLPNTILADRNLEVHVQPRTSIVRRTFQYAVPADIFANVPKDVFALAEKAEEKLLVDQEKLDAWAATIPNPDTEIMPLGTGSSVPSMLRNVSATVIRVPGHGTYLLDCGENTLGQLRRAYGDKLEDVLRDLRVIWISHLHADHHLGTAGLLKAWYETVHGSQPTREPLNGFSLAESLKKGAKSRRLSVISEPAMLRWLAEYSQCEDIGYSHIVPLFNLRTEDSLPNVPTLHIYTHGSDESQQSHDPYNVSKNRSSLALNPHVDPIPKELVYPLLGLSNFQTCFVPHCHGAQAVAFTWPDSLKISYSGDTRPCPAFARIGQDSTVCIHEATFETGMESEAKAKRHSTTGEAVGIAKAMNARACLLTHFSQRYPKIPQIPGMEIEAPASTQTGEEGLDKKQDGDHVPDIPMDNFDNEDGHDHDDCEIHSEAGADSDDSAEAARMIASAGSDLEVSIAFDFMKFKIKDMPKMRYFYPAFQRLLEENSKEMGDAVPDVGGVDVKKGKNGGPIKGAGGKAAAAGGDKGKNKQPKEPRQKRPALKARSPSPRRMPDVE